VILGDCSKITGPSWGLAGGSRLDPSHPTPAAWFIGGGWGRRPEDDAPSKARRRLREPPTHHPVASLQSGFSLFSEKEIARENSLSGEPGVKTEKS
jgi:hypothetical protein